MIVVGKKILAVFCKQHADVRSQVDIWLALAEEQEWRTPQNIRDFDNDASFLSDNQVVFNLKGKKYRLLVKVAYKRQVVKISKIATHAEYSKWKL